MKEHRILKIALKEIEDFGSGFDTIGSAFRTIIVQHAIQHAANKTWGEFRKFERAAEAHTYLYRAMSPTQVSDYPKYTGLEYIRILFEQAINLAKMEGR